MAIIRVNYTEPNPMTYKSVELSPTNGEDIIFKSGDFVKDWYDLIYYIIHSGISENEQITYSSTVDHFIMDDAPYISAYLKFKNNIPYLSYEYDSEDEGVEFFIPKGEKLTWEEYKYKYKNNEKAN